MDFWTLWEKARVGCLERTALKHVYYLGWNRSPAQVGCMRQVLRPGALGRARGIRRRGRWEGGSGRGTHVNPWLIHVNVWQKPIQYCKVISLQLIKINEKKKNPFQIYLRFPDFFLPLTLPVQSNCLSWDVSEIILSHDQEACILISVKFTTVLHDTEDTNIWKWNGGTISPWSNHCFPPQFLYLVKKFCVCVHVYITWI